MARLLLQRHFLFQGRQTLRVAHLFAEIVQFLADGFEVARREIRDGIESRRVHLRQRCLERPLEEDVLAVEVVEAVGTPRTEAKGFDEELDAGAPSVLP